MNANTAAPKAGAVARSKTMRRPRLLPLLLLLPLALGGCVVAADVRPGPVYGYGHHRPYAYAPPPRPYYYGPPPRPYYRPPPAYGWGYGRPHGRPYGHPWYRH